MLTSCYRALHLILLTLLTIGVWLCFYRLGGIKLLTDTVESILSHLPI